MPVELSSLVGRTITEVLGESGDKLIELVLDDGRCIQFEGGGYDGLVG